MLPQAFFGLFQPAADRCMPLHLSSRQISQRAFWAAGQIQKQLSVKKTCIRKRLSCVRATSGHMSENTFFLDDFATRQWDDPDYSGTRIRGNKQAFVDEMHRMVDEAS